MLDIHVQLHSHIHILCWGFLLNTHYLPNNVLALKLPSTLSFFLSLCCLFVLQNLLFLLSKRKFSLFKKVITLKHTYIWAIACNIKRNLHGNDGFLPIFQSELLFLLHIIAIFYYSLAFHMTRILGTDHSRPNILGPLPLAKSNDWVIN